jgi:hypothetical protein
MSWTVKKVQSLIKILWNSKKWLDRKKFLNGKKKKLNIIKQIIALPFLPFFTKRQTTRFFPSLYYRTFRQINMPTEYLPVTFFKNCEPVPTSSVAWLSRIGTDLDCSITVIMFLEIIKWRQFHVRHRLWWAYWNRRKSWRTVFLHQILSVVEPTGTQQSTKEGRWMASLQGKCSKVMKDPGF